MSANDFITGFIQGAVQPDCTMRSTAELVNGKCSQAVQGDYTTARLYKRKYSRAVQEEVQPGCTRGSAARLYKGKCSQAVHKEQHYSQAVQRGVQPGCTRKSAAGLYKGKCSQAVQHQREVQPDCTRVIKCSRAVQGAGPAVRL